MAVSTQFAYVLHPHRDESPLATQRVKWLGLFAHVLHIRSWELGDLPVRDFRLYVAWLEEYNRSNEG